MDKKTYKALKRIMKQARDEAGFWTEFGTKLGKEIKQVEDWIDEVAKDYQEGAEQDNGMYIIPPKEFHN